MLAPADTVGGLPCVPPINTSDDVVIVAPPVTAAGDPAAPPINTRLGVVIVSACGTDAGAGAGAGAGGGAGFGFGFDAGSRGEITGPVPVMGSLPGSVIVPTTAAALLRVLSAAAISFIPTAKADAVNDVADPSPL